MISKSVVEAEYSHSVICMNILAFNFVSLGFKPLIHFAIYEEVPYSKCRHWLLSEYFQVHRYDFSCIQTEIILPPLLFFVLRCGCGPLFLPSLALITTVLKSIKQPNHKLPHLRTFSNIKRKGLKLDRRPEVDETLHIKRGSLSHTSSLAGQFSKPQTKRQLSLVSGGAAYEFSCRSALTRLLLTF